VESLVDKQIDPNRAPDWKWYLWPFLGGLIFVGFWVAFFTSRDARRQGYHVGGKLYLAAGAGHATILAIIVGVLLSLSAGSTTVSQNSVTNQQPSESPSTTSPLITPPVNQCVANPPALETDLLAVVKSMVCARGGSLTADEISHLTGGTAFSGTYVSYLDSSGTAHYADLDNASGHWSFDELTTGGT